MIDNFSLNDIDTSSKINNKNIFIEETKEPKLRIKNEEKYKSEELKLPDIHRKKFP